MLVAREDSLGQFQGVARDLNKLIAIVPGGVTRQLSCAEGLRALGSAERVAVHDAARPNISAALLDRLLDAGGADVIIPAIPLSDTVKRVHNGTVTETVDREGLYRTQTPQVASFEKLKAAHRHAGEWTDEAAAIEAIGGTAKVIEGDPANIKVTTEGDLALLRRMMEVRGTVRTGIGYDVHRFAPGRPLVLGGVTIAHPRGLDGHSDADVLTHALCDALLGAAGLPDIGVLFPNTDPSLAGINSLRLLAEVAERLARAGWSTENLDSTLIAEEPRLAEHVPAMRERLAKTLGIGPDRVNVKATTNERLGALGAAEGIAAYAVATISRT